MVLLTNQEATGILASIVDRILDAYVAEQQTDWIKLFHKLVEQQRAQAASVEKKHSGERVASSKPSLPMDKYAGKYADAWYGDITISMESNGLVMRFSHSPGLTGDMERWQYDTFIVRWRDRSLAADAFVTFSLNPDGSIREVKMAPVSPLTDFSYDFQDLLIKPKT